jgi:hypothetical protein
MNDIPFEKVSVEEAKAAFNTSIAPLPAPQPEIDWETKRESDATANQELDPLTFKWLSQLPKDRRPNALARLFPHVANKLATLWKRPLHCELYLDDLVMDLRGGRRGFPAEVATEVATLREYFTTVVAPVRYDVWGERIGSAGE